MTKKLLGVFAVLALLAGCSSMSVGPQAGGPVPRIEGTPGKAVIYVVRGRPDTSNLAATLTLDGNVMGSTHAGTYMRLEVPAGRHSLSGYGQDNGAITLDVQSDRIYFVSLTVSGSWRAQSPHSFFSVTTESRARAAMAGALNAMG